MPVTNLSLKRQRERGMRIEAESAQAAAAQGNDLIRLVSSGRLEARREGPCQLDGADLIRLRAQRPHENSCHPRRKQEDSSAGNRTAMTRREAAALGLELPGQRPGCRSIPDPCTGNGHGGLSVLGTSSELWSAVPPAFVAGSSRNAQAPELLLRRSKWS